ncbi:sensor histidine kinase [Plantactinospora sp. S1510]|uniref:histidine kinase n=1 Tax=Plantactinospora alkalitolerans TaxID=2789879 RepID=A0ABS0GQH2_9ACTN|nr:sensor histidine kinase [Plantactinospora alkalitolerans]MBF9128451.1 sensor histidine kinase [Plantactinospora alkalitolerans]
MPAPSTASADLVRRLTDRHPLLLDGLVVAATITVGLALASQHPPGDLLPMDLRGYLLTGLMNGMLLFRQRAPVLVLVGYCALFAGWVTIGYWPVVNSPGLLLALYTVAARCSVRTAVAAATLSAAVWTYGGAESIVLAAVQGVVWMFVILWIGHGARQLTIRNQQLTRLTAQLEGEQLLRARRAVIEERVRIAQEMHDVVAHHMAVASVQAGLARYVLESDPDTARAALGTVLDTTGEALEEMRRVLSVLRLGSDDEDVDDSYRPTPGLGQLDELVNRVRAAGLRLEVRRDGDARPLPGGADLCAYRVIQESLTNVLKHAGQARATLVLRYGADRLTIRVSDDGVAVAPAPSTAASSGHGLRGMRERAELYGGTLRAGPRPDGGFEVVLTLPTIATMEGRRRDEPAGAAQAERDYS